MNPNPDLSPIVQNLQRYNVLDKLSTDGIYLIREPFWLIYSNTDPSNTNTPPPLHPLPNLVRIKGLLASGQGVDYNYDPSLSVHANREYDISPTNCILTTNPLSCIMEHRPLAPNTIPKDLT